MSKKKLERMSRNTLIVLGMGVSLTSQMMCEASLSKDLAGQQDKAVAIPGLVTVPRSSWAEVHLPDNLGTIEVCRFDNQIVARGYEDNTGKAKLLIRDQSSDSWKEINPPGLSSMSFTFPFNRGFMVWGDDSTNTFMEWKSTDLINWTSQVIDGK